MLHYMNKIGILLCILLFVSCKNKNSFTKYHEDGSKTIWLQKDSVEIYKNDYYANGKIKQKTKLIHYSKEGWSIIYDSLTSKVIRKIFYIHSEIYTDIIFKKNGCKYFYMKPYIPIESDTIYMSNKNNLDSLPILFFKQDSFVHIDKFIVANRIIVDGKEKNYIYVVPSFQEKTYINYQDTFWYVKGFKFAVQVQLLNPICCCDSIETPTTNKIVIIK